MVEKINKQGLFAPTPPLFRSLPRDLLPPLWRHVLGALLSTLRAKRLRSRIFAVIGDRVFLFPGGNAGNFDSSAYNVSRTLLSFRSGWHFCFSIRFFSSSGECAFQDDQYQRRALTSDQLPIFRFGVCKKRFFFFSGFAEVRRLDVLPGLAQFIAPSSGFSINFIPIETARQNSTPKCLPLSI